MCEKHLNDVAAGCRELYEGGCAATAQWRLDDAIALFNQALAQEPGLVECREALRKAQMARFQKKNAFAHAVDELCEVLELLKAEVYSHSKPLKALDAAEQALNRNPTSTLAHKIFAEAALKNGMFRTASLSLDFIRKNGGTEDVDVNLAFANVLAESGNVSQGLAICGRMLKEFPNNPRVARTLERLSKLAFDEHEDLPRPRASARRHQKMFTGHFAPNR